MSNRFLRWVGLACYLTMLLGTSRNAGAQDLPTVFVHGVMADSTTWNFLAADLSAYLQIAPIARTTRWYAN